MYYSKIKIPNVDCQETIKDYKGSFGDFSKSIGPIIYKKAEITDYNMQLLKMESAQKAPLLLKRITKGCPFTKENEILKDADMQKFLDQCLKEYHNFKALSLYPIGAAVYDFKVTLVLKQLILVG